MLSNIAVRGCTAGILFVLIEAAASAHHSFAPHFDATRKVSISGTVKAYEARNPHSYLHVNALDENGRTREYVCESHGTTQMSRIGITPQLFKPGTKLRVVGSLSRHSPYMCFFETIEFSDGRTMNVNGAGGSSPTPPSTAVRQRKDIFGIWLLAPIPNRSTSGPQPMMQSLTPAGEKAGAGHGPVQDHPTFRCDAVAIRRVWGAPGTPLEIVRQGDDIVLHHEWMDVRRVIHMNTKDH